MKKNKEEKDAAEPDGWKQKARTGGGKMVFNRRQFLVYRSPSARRRFSALPRYYSSPAVQPCSTWDWKGDDNCNSAEVLGSFTGAYVSALSLRPCGRNRFTKLQLSRTFPFMSKSGNLGVALNLTASRRLCFLPVL